MAADTPPAAIGEAEQDALIRRRVLRGVVSNYAGQAVTIGTWILLTPFILARLGPATYGLWALVGSVIGYGALLDFGIGGAVIKYVAEYRARGALDEARALIATALQLYTALGVFGALLAIVLAPFFPMFFRVSAQDSAITSQLVLLMGLTLGISLPCSTASAVLAGLQRYDLVNLFTLFWTLASALGTHRPARRLGLAGHDRAARAQRGHWRARSGTVIVLLVGWGLLGMIAINLPIMLVLQLALIRTLRRIEPELHFGWRGAERQLRRSVLAYSSSVFIIQAAGQLQTKTDEIVIGITLPVSAITPYSLARKLSEAAQIVANQFMKVLLPLASELHATDDRTRLRMLYVLSTRLTLAIILPIACVLIFLSRSLLTLWVGPVYAGNAHLVVILTIASVFVTSQWPAGHILQGMARHRTLALMALANGSLNLVLSIALAPRFGLTGVAFATLIPAVLESLFLVLPYALRSVQVTPAEAWRAVGLPTLIPIIPTTLVVWGLSSIVSGASIIALAAVAVAGLIVYAVGYLAFPATKTERELCHTLLDRAIQLVRARLHRA